MGRASFKGSLALRMRYADTRCAVTDMPPKHLECYHRRMHLDDTLHATHAPRCSLIVRAGGTRRPAARRLWGSTRTPCATAWRSIGRPRRDPGCPQLRHPGESWTRVHALEAPRCFRPPALKPTRRPDIPLARRRDPVDDAHAAGWLRYSARRRRVRPGHDAALFRSLRCIRADGTQRDAVPGLCDRAGGCGPRSAALHGRRVIAPQRVLRGDRVLGWYGVSGALCDRCAD